jgi:hypothetical protein
MKSSVVKILLGLCSALLLSGCVSRKAASLEPRSDGDQAVVFSKKLSGLLPGVCGFYVGSSDSPQVSIRLLGLKDRYNSNEFVIVPAPGSELEATKDDDSFIEVNRRDQWVRIAIRQNGRAFPWNGRRRYVEAAE